MATVNKASLAELLGYSEQTLTEWQAEGMPILRAGARGESNEYDTAAVVRWMLERSVRKVRAESPRDEYYKAQTEKVRRENAERAREIVPAADVEAHWAGLVLMARNQLLRLPSRLAPLLEDTAGESAKRELLAKEIDEALRELSESSDDELLDRLLARLKAMDEASS